VVTKPLSAHRDEMGHVLITRTLAVITVTPWVQRLLEIVAAIDAVSVQKAIDSHLPEDEGMVSGDARDLLPPSLWLLVDEEGATDTQIACAAFDCGFMSMVDTLWGDTDDVEALPASPEQARQALKEWLASSPAPDDHLYVTALEHALAQRFGEMGVTTRKILVRLDAAQEEAKAPA
jgi:hypothetical protein